jgi:Response regulator containing a CheY-like receiver domain and an HTH DNA-binding domain
MKKIKILFVEDDPDFTFLIDSMLKSEPDFDIVGHTDNKDDAISLAEKTQPDIVLMDLNLSLGELDGIEAAKQIRLRTDAKIILLTAFEQPEISIEASKKAFASSYIYKSQYEILCDTVKKTASGKTPQECFINALILSELSPAEQYIFNLMLGKDIQVLSSEKTIANQKTNIFKKLGIKNSNELKHIFRNM